ncbi:TM2 domain-containing protein 1 isoform X2 [Loxodonta africana]|nr:TM2 domain-containing protein 1 isoform X1 [Loxodonta africana]XP_010589526.1 TM2 domain-containing protein 1 isoform X1 [Loxodonta africana]XP_023405293.1 TM2 domain-containing protein 1 isoform X1 [Loxodonta africana]XP_023405294.1 TM2 domain-containing protein 1 isoform X1 [Loxodonta africana]XP_023405296.1 TM2 domain-containing protein 1 isoform X1 [Loxodonta africana]
MASTWSSGLAAPESLAVQLLGVLWFVSVTTGPWGAAATTAAGGEETLKCEDLKVGQYICKDPKINEATQEPVNCTNYTAHVLCFPAPNITCKDFSGNETHFTGNEVGFLKPISCRNVNGYSYKVAVALSLFLGWLGADRFYLGYPALGLLKFCTVGFCGIGSLIDFILISMQIVGPSDGSSYIIDYYGTRLTRLSITNETFRKTQLYP